MKLPKRISDILKRKQEFIDSQRGKMENSVIRLQSRLFNDIISELIPELNVKDGLIQDTAKNYRLISVLDKTYKDFQAASSQVMVNQIITGTKKIAKLSNEYYSSVLAGDITAKFAKIVTKTEKLINIQIGLEGDKIFKGGWLDSYFNSSTLGMDLKQMTSKAVTSQINMKEYVNNLKDMVVGSEERIGGLEKQFNAYGYDLYQQYDAAYNVTIGNELGFNYFIYQGGLIADSRDFCAAHNNKVWSREEMKEWPNWTPAQGEYPPGYEIKQKNIYEVPSYLSILGYDPGINRGGPRCRHQLGWIPDDIAFDMRPELKEGTDEENLT